MKHSYPYWRGNPSPVAGVVAGTLGVWTLFDYGGEPGPWPLVASSFGQELSSRKMRLTPQEMEISDMVKRGMTNKEISRLFCKAV